MTRMRDEKYRERHAQGKRFEHSRVLPAIFKKFFGKDFLKSFPMDNPQGQYRGIDHVVCTPSRHIYVDAKSEIAYSPNIPLEWVDALHGKQQAGWIRPDADTLTDYIFYARPNIDGYFIEVVIFNVCTVREWLLSGNRRNRYPLKTVASSGTKIYPAPLTHMVGAGIISAIEYVDNTMSRILTGRKA